MIWHIPHSLENLHYRLDDNRFIHYTCNPAKKDVLDKYWIFSIWDKFNCTNPWEVIIITEKTIKDILWFIPENIPELISLSIEQILRNIS
jgi:hypothetical protein